VESYPGTSGASSARRGWSGNDLSLLGSPVAFAARLVLFTGRYKKLKLASQLRLPTRLVASSACYRLALPSADPLGLLDSPSQVQLGAERFTPHRTCCVGHCAPLRVLLRLPSYL